MRQRRKSEYDVKKKNSKKFTRRIQKREDFKEEFSICGFSMTIQNQTLWCERCLVVENERCLVLEMMGEILSTFYLCHSSNELFVFFIFLQRSNCGCCWCRINQGWDCSCQLMLTWLKKLACFTGDISFSKTAFILLFAFTFAIVFMAPFNLNFLTLKKKEKREPMKNLVPQSNFVLLLLLVLLFFFWHFLSGFFVVNFLPFSFDNKNE
jgi:hypothetical protein